MLESAQALECVATSGASESLATSQKPCSVICDRSIITLRRLSCFTSSLPASFSPAPVSGEAGNLNGTPCVKRLRRLCVRPDRAQAGGVERLKRVAFQVQRFGALEVQQHRKRAIVEARLQLGSRADDLDVAVRFLLDLQQLAEQRSAPRSVRTPATSAPARCSRRHRC